MDAADAAGWRRVFESIQERQMAHDWRHRAGATNMRLMRMRTLISVLAAITLCGSCGSKPSPTSIVATQPALSGQPSWLPLGPEVYHENERDDAAKQVLSFRPEPRWFVGFAKLGTL